VQTIIGMAPHIIVMGMPLLIIFIMTSQHALSISMLIMPVGLIRQVIPCVVMSRVMSGTKGIPQQLIIGIPQHIIMHGVPLCIMPLIIEHAFFTMSIVASSPGVMVHIIPLSVMVQAMRHDMGSMMGTGIGEDMGMLGIAIGEAAFMGLS
jgi:hypothetical protein